MNEDPGKVVHSHTQLELRDLIAAKKLWLSRKKWVFWLSILGILALVIRLGYDFWRLSQGQGFHGTGPLLGLIYFLFVWHRLVYASSKKQWKESNVLQMPFETEWRVDRLKMHSERGEMQMRYVDYWRIDSNEQMILLFQSGSAFQIIPKKSFASEADYAWVREQTKHRL